MSLNRYHRLALHVSCCQCTHRPGPKYLPSIDISIKCQLLKLSSNRLQNSTQRHLFWQKKKYNIVSLCIYILSNDLLVYPRWSPLSLAAILKSEFLYIFLMHWTSCIIHSMFSGKWVCFPPIYLQYQSSSLGNDK